MGNRSRFATVILILSIVIVVGVAVSPTIPAVHAQTCYQSYSGSYPYYYYYYPSYSWYYPYYYGYSFGNYNYYSGYYNYPYGTCVQLTANATPASINVQVTGGGGYYQGSTATFSVSQSTIQISPDTRYVFAHWTGDYSGTGTSGTITMSGTKTVTAVYQLQYHLNVGVQPGTAPVPGGEGWYNAGDTANLSVPAPIIPVDTGTQLAFSSWQVDGGSSQSSVSLPLTMNSPHSVTAQYQLQYYLKINADQGVPSGEGWYNAGSWANVSVSNPTSSSYGVSINFNGWQGDMQSSAQSTRVQMDRPKTIVATWTTDSTVLNLTILLAIIAAFAIGIFLGFIVLKKRTAAGPEQPTRLPTVPRGATPSTRSKPSATPSTKDQEKTKDQDKLSKDEEKTREPPL